MNNESNEVNNESNEIEIDALWALLHPGSQAAVETVIETPVLVETPVAEQVETEVENSSVEVQPAVDPQIQNQIETPENEKPFGTIEATNKVEDAIAFGGLDFEVESFEIKPVLKGEEGEPEEGWVIPSFTGIRRTDDKQVVFAVLHDTYTPVQNRQILEYVTPLLEATGGEFTRVGSYDNGAGVFAYITLNETLTLPGGQVVKQELVLTSSHNGSKCLELKVVASINGATVRQNTVYGLRHTKGVHIKAQEVVKIVERKNAFFQQLSEEVNQLAQQAVSSEEADAWIKKFLEFPTQADVTTHPSKIAGHERLYSAFKTAVAGQNTKLALVLAVACDRAHTVPVKNTKHYVTDVESRFKSSLNGTSSRKLDAAWLELLKP